jgi:hypothetical protein
MRRYEGRLAGLLGTVIIHLIAAILFFSVKLNTLKREREKEFILVFEEFSEEPDPDLSTTLPLSDDEMPEIDQMIRNIVRNLANPENPVIDPQEYQDMVKEEMIMKGLLGEDNFIDDWKKRETEEGAIEIAEKLRDEYLKTQEEKEPINYQGPTRVYYRLENRFHTYLPIPVYKCEGAGKVSLTIEVDREGMVLSAKIIPGETTTKDQCLLETAVSYALMSRFNRSPNFPAKQTGTLTFHFVAQGLTVN